MYSYINDRYELLIDDHLTDNTYLNYLLNKHNSTIKLSKMIIISSREDFLLDYARRLISRHNIEVAVLVNLLKSIPNIQSIKTESKYIGFEANTNNYQTMCENYSINKQYDFDKPKLLIENITNDYKTDEIINDKIYIDTMIEYYKDAINLSKKVITKSKEPKILHLAHIFIMDKSKEVFLLENLHQCIKYVWRNQ